MPRGPDRDEDKSSRLSRWRASWRVALRMAKRDAWRYKGRSVLVLIMVALPVGVLVGTLVFATTLVGQTAWSGSRRSLGSAQALVQGPGEQAVWQTADPDEGWATRRQQPAAQATPVPGFDTERQPRFGGQRRSAATGHRRHGRARRRDDHAARPRREAHPRHPGDDLRGRLGRPGDQGHAGLRTVARHRGRDRRNALRHQPGHAGPRHHHAPLSRAGRSTSPSSASPTSSTGGAGSPTPSPRAHSTRGRSSTGSTCSCATRGCRTPR